MNTNLHVQSFDRTINKVKQDNNEHKLFLAGSILIATICMIAVACFKKSAHFASTEISLTFSAISLAALLAAYKLAQPQYENISDKMRRESVTLNLSDLRAEEPAHPEIPRMMITWNQTFPRGVTSGKYSTVHPDLRDHT